MIEILTSNFQDMVSYDYETIFHCEESGCYDEGICRCGTISSSYVKKVEVSKIVEFIHKKIFDNSISTKRHKTINSLWGITDDIELYTIDRILRINKIWKTEFWNINTGPGYYGEEVKDILLDIDVAEMVKNHLEIAFDINNLSERIEYLLLLENGYILDDIKNSRYEIQIINRDDILFPNREHYRRVIIEDLEHYADFCYSTIRAIVKKDGKKFKLIDGYHRCIKTEDQRLKVLVASN